MRKYYAAAEKGLEELAEAQRMICELYREVVEGFVSHHGGLPTSLYAL